MNLANNEHHTSVHEIDPSRMDPQNPDSVDPANTDPANNSGNPALSRKPPPRLPESDNAEPVVVEPDDEFLDEEIDPIPLIRYPV